ncbi:hypothetical protein KJ885_01040 [Patescibacteria group bacterium]|nr:hypothetical protein [Patescibacteria group bacterium]
MHLIVHATAGALVGQATGNPWLGFIYGVLSHIILDMIPHGDSSLYQRYKRKEISTKKVMATTVLDSIAAIVFVIIIFNLGIYGSKLVTSMAILGAIIPDVMIGLYELASPKAPKFLKIIHKWHFKNHDLFASRRDFSWKNGFLLQIIIFFVLLKIL